MKVAIIGAGNVGKALGTSIARAGHDVVFASTGDSAKQAAEQIGSKASAASPRDAASQADIVILAVPYSATREVATELAGAVEGKIVIDVSNPMAPDMSGLATERGTSAAENIGRWLLGANMVKAFNTLFASVQANPTVDGQQADALFATDDPKVREKVASLLSDMGFRPIWVGGLARARELEPMGFMNILLQMNTGGSWNTTYKLIAPPAASVEHRAAAGAGTTTNK